LAIVRVLKQMIDAAGIERTGAAHQIVHFVALFQQKFRQLRAVPAGNACDECAAWHGMSE
jgi:hypothetical protein